MTTPDLARRPLDQRGRSNRLAALWREAPPVFLVGLVAAGFRLYRLADLPPGLHHDEAVNGLDILITIPASHPVFFELNNGREPLFIYLQALVVHLLGPSVYSLRLTAAVVGVLTVLATYWLARQWLGRWVATLAALGLATSFWHVDLSRVGLRAIAAPLFLVLALAFLWRGLRRGELASFVLAGLAVGLGFDSYISARVVPLLIAVVLVWEGLVGRSRIRRRWAGLASMVVAGAIVAAPLAVYFADHPDSFLGRTEQVSILNPTPTIEGRPDSFGDNLSRTLGMFLVRGDDNPRHDLPGRPVFDAVAGPWFILGLAVALWGSAQVVRRRLSRQPTDDSAVPAADSQAWPETLSTTAEAREAQSAYPWLLLWLVSTLALGALSYESPNFLRLTALTPAIYVAWAIGLATAGRWLASGLAWLAMVVKRRPELPGRGMPFGDTPDRGSLGDSTSGQVFSPRRPGAGAKAVWLVAAALGLALVAREAGRTYGDYFGEWAARADVYRAFDGGLSAAARYVEAVREPSAADVFYVDRSPTVLYLSPRARSGRWLQEYSNVLLLPPAGATTAVYVFAGDGSTAGGPQLFFSGRQPDGQGLDPAGLPAYTAYRLGPDEVASLQRPATHLQQAFGDARGRVELLGYSLDSTSTTAGGRLGVTLLWRVAAGGEVVYAPYLHILDEAGRSWGQDDRLGFVVSGWHEGDLFLSRHEWLVPPDSPPLEYRFEAGMAVRAFGFPPGSAEALGQPIEIARVRVDRAGTLAPGVQPPPVGHLIGLSLGAGLVLVGYDSPAGQLKPGGRLPVDLLWQSVEAPGRDVLARLDLVDSAGRTRASDTARPAYGHYPTSLWPAGTILRDPRAVLLPGDLTAGSFRLVLQTIDAGSGEEIGRTTLGAVEVVEPPRSFDLPPLRDRVDADFGGEIALRGFELDGASLAPGGTVHLTLYWQALRPPTKSYTVFTHLLDSADRVVAQQDGLPARGGAPTLGWAAGQVVRDEYDLKLPIDQTAGDVLLEVGLYDAATGQRLRLASDRDDRVILARLPLAPAVPGP